MRRATRFCSQFDTNKAYFGALSDQQIRPEYPAWNPSFRDAYIKWLRRVADSSAFDATNLSSVADSQLPESQLGTTPHPQQRTRPSSVPLLISPYHAETRRPVAHDFLSNNPSAPGTHAVASSSASKMSGLRKLASLLDSNVTTLDSTKWAAIEGKIRSSLIYHLGCIMEAPPFKVSFDPEERRKVYRWP
ncbi:hypothetical protein LY78DRAFT_684951 [Colletotrichum sublineola]|nr:hypothetical protein LY78DRAFT_684951 [Colletotrichum sublineola]